ncbi:M15 family metallopeptidase [Nocardia cyriacigeorgica]|uniref:M15 family metallopeptidase n=1 Tax=Nocardia cyriacigeorgica TaxID=135487 RepID=A0A6P1D2L0_9NOCA|nr:M15 family metallopeptidase [Nocardia cyriacigeorgica]NEW41994.1 M15 family metallopeptidase [Nocardia cyriacigeorgica]NEW44776.1 M15 family metallopeptidase [Nocardia cyriacigeorgica]NEW50478.1 M15 family metallopeptidase [Nocardia cyriacigeorgica]NEW59345.1 M15 family metallopeptidase [Nocardia cyriacigeorgica]
MWPIGEARNRRRPRRHARIAIAAAVAPFAVALSVAGPAKAAPESQPASPPSGAAPVRPIAAAGTEGLNPLLALAYTMAADEAHAAGVPLSITSGYRTPAEQQALWDDGIHTHGNPAEARRWVLPPDESTHVTGHAIDVGPIEGARWLEANGNRWGLCRTFDNEWWHFELATFPGLPCPPRVPDASVR